MMLHPENRRIILPLRRGDHSLLVGTFALAYTPTLLCASAPVPRSRHSPGLGAAVWVFDPLVLPSGKASRNVVQVLM